MACSARRRIQEERGDGIPVRCPRRARGCREARPELGAHKSDILSFTENRPICALFRRCRLAVLHLSPCVFINISTELATPLFSSTSTEISEHNFFALCFHQHL
jgi:hypothetical protein